MKNENFLPGVGGNKRAIFMFNCVSLPQWLDDYIFNQQKANYCPFNSDMTVIDWDKNNVLNYLGTYFPRSYTEAYCIFSEYFKQHLQEWQNRESISVFDFGCGTGGEIIGLLEAIGKCLPCTKQVRIIAFDGNQDALRLFEDIIQSYSEQAQLNIQYQVIPVRIDDFYDLTILDTLLTDKYDIIMSFKSICEFVTKERFEKQNAYEHIVRFLLSKLNDDGIVVLVDVTSYNNVSQKWLPCMMDKGLKAAGCNVVSKNDGYNQAFFISHSERIRDISKVAWRIVQK